MTRKGTDDTLLFTLRRDSQILDVLQADGDTKDGEVISLGANAFMSVEQDK